MTTSTSQKTIGLIGGMSWESSAEYYRLINTGIKARLGGHNNAKSLMVTVNFEHIKTLQHAEQWDQLACEMAEAARSLQAGGADFIVLCTNTMHKVWTAIEDAVEIPALHIADPTAAAIKHSGYSKVGLLGTRFTMEQDFYRGRLEKLHDLEVIVPSDTDRDLVHSVIYDELCHGNINASSRQQFQRVIQDLKAQGAQCVILGCTEIMLLIAQNDSALPVFDTTALHVAAAIDAALDASPNSK
ncbi:aspartate/glutamate racemase family protein [Glaciimonas soli]|uniref:Amino acid racemase n=1 Tax=Glaciimonas soli TaxID=2590999 RepID=A0A843YS47_9BURK|nr:aspartate/glutamate racemase family protein [Glaciimonas soli]MQR00544.1 amino acid racemase [Glaciimonas soli]